MTRAGDKRLNWNVVATVNETFYASARIQLASYGVCHKTAFRNVLVAEIDDVDVFLARFLDAWMHAESLRRCFARVVPVTTAFTFQTPDEFEDKARAMVEPWLATLADHSFHVRVHRRGFRGRLSGSGEERQIGQFLVEKLAAAGLSSAVTFDDPDTIVVIEIVGQRAGASLWTREQRARYPFLKLD